MVRSKNLWGKKIRAVTNIRYHGGGSKITDIDGCFYIYHQYKSSGERIKAKKKSI